DFNFTFKNECIDAISFFFYFVRIYTSFCEISYMKPGILIDPNTLIVFVRRNHLIKLIVFCNIFNGNLVITWRYIFLLRKHPNLKKFNFFVFVLVVFRMGNTSSSTQYLYIAFFNYGYISHTVFML